MRAIIRAILRHRVTQKRVAAALEGIRDLYEMDLRSRGIYSFDPKIRDKVEISYGPQEPVDQDEDSFILN